MPEFVPFRFEVNLYNEKDEQMLCRGYFSEVSGLELTMEPRVITEGGRNWGEHQRVGVTKFSPVILKRGVTDINDLWAWFDATTRGANYGYRLQGEIKVFGSTFDENKVPKTVMIWKLGGVLPTKFKGSDLSSTANQVAIEELHLVHESLTIERPPAA
jgi:phage tail-like protein